MTMEKVPHYLPKEGLSLVQPVALTPSPHNAQPLRSKKGQASS